MSLEVQMKSNNLNGPIYSNGRDYLLHDQGDPEHVYLTCCRKVQSVQETVPLIFQSYVMLHVLSSFVIYVSLLPQTTA